MWSDCSQYIGPLNMQVGMPYVAGKLESKYSKFLTQEEVQGLAAQEEVQDLAAQEEVQDLAAQDEKRDHVVFRRMSVKFFKIFPFCHFVAVVSSYHTPVLH